MKKYIIYLLIIFIFLPCYVQGNDNIKVAVTIVPGKTFIKAVGGDLVDVVVMIPPGYSPANYSPSPSKYKKLSNSSLYFSFGVPADKNSILPKVKKFNNNIEIIKLYKEVAKKYPVREFEPGKRDPHFWLSPKRVKVAVDIIAKKLAKLDYDNKKAYYENARKYKNKLSKLDSDITEIFKGLDNRTFIIYHPSFGYFADDYNLKMIAVEKKGHKTTASRLKEIINLAREKKIKHIFCQQEIDSKQTRALAEELKGETVQIYPLAFDYINNLYQTALILKKSLE